MAALPGGGGGNGPGSLKFGGVGARGAAGIQLLEAVEEGVLGEVAFPEVGVRSAGEGSRLGTEEFDIAFCVADDVLVWVPAKLGSVGVR
ncbi:MAG: hypothetical protein NZ703_03140 [Gemmataceae bacterium]|nr:hypothetical protein [Gemmataceae bacterium]